MIRWKVIENIGYIQFDGPRGNALTQEDISTLIHILDCECDGLCGLILIGKNHAFCAGLDIDNMPDFSFRELDELLLRLYSLPIPVTIALSGHAIGAGFLMLPCADYIVALDEPRAKFGLPERKIGLTIDGAMLCLLESILPCITIQKLLYSSDYVNINQLDKWGLVNTYCDNSIQLVESCKAWIHSMNEHPKSFYACKQVLRSSQVNNIQTTIETQCYELIDNLRI